MMKSVYLCFLLLGVYWSSCQAEHLPEDDDQDPNAFVDSIFATAVNKIHQQGAISIPGEHKVGPLGLLTIKDVQLLDIENIARRGDANIEGNEDSGIMDAKTALSLTNVRAKASFLVNMIKKGLIKVSATILIKKIDLTVACEFNPGKNTLKPNKVHIDAYDGVETDVKGLGPFNPIVEKMTTITADVLEKLVAKILNMNLNSKLNGLVIDVPQP